MPGAIAATRGGICVDFNRMNKILETHKEDMDVIVQPAANWQDLNAHLVDHDLFFPPAPSPGAKIGGMVSLQRSFDIVATANLTDDTDRYELFRHERVPTRSHKTMGCFDDRSARGWDNR